jgi:hypothetical protein
MGNDIYKILRKSFIRDLINYISLILILSPIIFAILFEHYKNIIIKPLIISIILVGLYLLSWKVIQKIQFRINDIKILYPTRFKNRYLYIPFSSIIKTNYYSTLKGGSGLLITYKNLGSVKQYAITCNKKNGEILEKNILEKISNY